MCGYFLGGIHCVGITMGGRGGGYWCVLRSISERISSALVYNIAGLRA